MDEAVRVGVEDTGAETAYGSHRVRYIGEGARVWDAYLATWVRVVEVTTCAGTHPVCPAGRSEPCTILVVRPWATVTATATRVHYRSEAFVVTLGWSGARAR